MTIFVVVVVVLVAWCALSVVAVALLNLAKWGVRSAAPQVTAIDELARRRVSAMRSHAPLCVAPLAVVGAQPIAATAGAIRDRVLVD